MGETMRLRVKELDGQRSLEIEVTDELPDSVFLFREGWCMEFDVSILLRAVDRVRDSQRS
jgi:hypothetical protein